MSKTLMKLVGEALAEAGVSVVDGKLVVPVAENVDGAVASLKGSPSVAFNTLQKIEAEIKKVQNSLGDSNESLVAGASSDYDNLEKIELAVKGILSVVSTDAERIKAVNDLVSAYEGADDFIKGLVGGKLGKDDTAKNSLSLGGKTLTEVVEIAKAEFESSSYGTTDEFLAALGA